MVRKVKIHIRLSHTYTTTPREFYVATRRARARAWSRAFPDVTHRVFVSLRHHRGQEKNKGSWPRHWWRAIPGQHVTEVFPPITNLGGQA